MKFTIWIVASLCAVLAGCTTTSPFNRAVRGTCYTPEEFNRAVIAEKIAFLQNEITNLQAPEPSDPNQINLRPFMIREFPTMSEWEALQKKVKPGDRICEYHHELYLQSYDGPVETNRRGFALIREDRIIAFVYVD